MFKFCTKSNVYAEDFLTNCDPGPERGYINSFFQVTIYKLCILFVAQLLGATDQRLDGN